MGDEAANALHAALPAPMPAWVGFAQNAIANVLYLVDGKNGPLLIGFRACLTGSAADPLERGTA